MASSFALLLMLSAAAVAIASIFAATIWRTTRNTLSLRARTMTVSMVFLLLAPASIALYLHQGAYGIADALSARAARFEILDAQIVRTENATGSPEKWLSLGALLIERERFADAAAAFKKAVLSSKGDPAAILLYAKAQVLAAGGKVTPEAKRDFEMAHRLRPDEPEAELFLAVAAAQNGDAAQAKTMLERLSRRLPADHPLQSIIARHVGHVP